MRIAIHISLLILLIACKRPITSPQWQLVFKSNKQGQVELGSKEMLISHIRAGADLKIAWGHQGKTHSIEHISEPIWIAILDEEEVMAHLAPQVLSQIDWENLSVAYKNPDFLREEWRVVLSTQGTFDAVWYDRKADTIIKRIPQQHPMSWYVRAKRERKDNIPFFQ